MKVYIYSSGSVEAQKLLFGHSTEGDILEVGYLITVFLTLSKHVIMNLKGVFYDYKPRQRPDHCGYICQAGGEEKWENGSGFKGRADCFCCASLGIGGS